MTYYYWVEAINAAGYSPASSMVSRKLSAGTPTLTVPTSPVTVSGTSAGLSVTGSDPTGAHEPISYNWTIVSAPQGASVQLNGAAPSATNIVTTITNLMNATFSQAGSYVFQVTAIDASGMSNAEDITVTVNQVLTSIAVDPPAPTVIDGQTQIFTAAAYDQFNNPMPLGGGATWSVQTGGVGGTITATGAGQATYTAPTSAVGSDAVVVSVGSINGVGTATVVSVNDVTPSVFSTNLVGLTWTGRSDAQYYQVYSETSGADFTPSYDNLIGDGLTTPWFEDDSVTAGNTYYYQVYSIDDSGNSTEVGTCSIATPAASSPSVQTLPSLGGGETPAAQAPMPPPATPNTVQAIGVNDLELFVSWTQPSQTNVCGYTIDISTDKVNWSLAAVAEPASAVSLRLANAESSLSASP